MILVLAEMHTHKDNKKKNFVIVFFLTRLVGGKPFICKNRFRVAPKNMERR